MTSKFNPHQIPDSFKMCISLVFALVLLCWLPRGAGAGEPTANYCKDASSWQEWHDLLEKYPDDDVVCALYAMRRGVCSMVDAGSIPLARAADIFEKMKESVIEHHKEQGKVVEKKAKQGIWNEIRNPLFSGKVILL